MPSSTLKIREFRPDDFEELYQMDQVCFPEGIAYSRWEFVFYLNHRRGIVRIAEKCDRIAGFVLARIERLSIAHMITLDVAPEFRRCGVGTFLMHDVHQEFRKRKVGTSILEVETANVAARHLYRKLGYRETALLAGYYRGREDAFRMELVIGVNSR